MDLVQRLPAQLREGKVARRLNGALQRGCPDADRWARRLVKGQRQPVKDDVREDLSVLVALIADAGVASQEPEYIVLRLAVPAEPNLPRARHARLADLHQEEHNLPGNVAADAVYVQVAPARYHVDELDVVDIAVSDGFIDLLVAQDALLEVHHGLLHIHALVVGAEHHLVAVVGLEHRGVVADALQEQVLVRAVELLNQETPPFLCAVGGIKDGHLRVLGAQPRQHVIQRRQECLLPLLLSVLVVLVKERGILGLVACVHAAAVEAHIEVAGAVPKPVEVGAELVAEKRLASAR
mmetsp:Transcript_18685/g.48867  ORF Transcript_18685/g.48867 Transcript_18685/m.48867 type:complete len:295 (+) Transcript_18685:669-1553(+)